MSRVPLRELDDLPPAFERIRQERVDDPMALPVLQGFADAPELFVSYQDWYKPWHLSDPSVPARVPARLKELLRLRLATFTGCRMCKSARLASDVVPEDLAASIDGGVELSPSELAALRFAEKFAVDHFSLEDDDFASLREHFDNAQVLELVMLIGIAYIGGGLVMSVLQLDNAACPVPSAAPAWTAEPDRDAGMIAQREFEEAARAAAAGR